MTFKAFFLFVGFSVVHMESVFHSSLIALHFPEVKGSSPCCHISQEGLTLIQGFEGLRLKPYRDSGGVQTIGYGHALQTWEPSLTTITPEQALRILKMDIQPIEKSLAVLFTFPLTQNQVDALSSFMFNIGLESFKRSHVYLYLRQKDFKRALSFWRQWIYDSSGRREWGLVVRRKKETALFREG